MVAGMIVATPLPPFFLETDFQNEGGRDCDLNFETNFTDRNPSLFVDFGKS